ncbi:MAG: SGNH/GDSL hydrolase family protein [Bacteroidales bacterium]|nr:SGNH/GDSL hydrolase family protein [Bacteroidales bacterium]
MRRFLSILLCAAVFQGSMAAQSFVQLGRYRNDNEQLAKPAKKSARTVFMGDSITDFWPKRYPEFFTDESRIGRGISGEVTAQMLLRFRSDVIDLGATRVVILAGTNDIALNQGDYNEDFTFGNIVSMVELAKAHKIKPVICSVLPAKKFGWRPEVTDAPAKIASLNKRLKEYAAKKHITYIDYFTPMVAEDGESLRNEYSPDGVHPNHDGYAVMESVYLKALKK